MFCSMCGTKNEDNASKCVQCGNDVQPLQHVGLYAPDGRRIPNYLDQAILVTIFCCLPFGITAIVFAAGVNKKLAVGDYDGAVEKSKKAKTWCWVSFGVGLGFIIIFLLSSIGAIREAFQNGLIH
jgi:hypothetical protein